MTLLNLRNKIYLYSKTNANSLSDSNMLLFLNTAYERVATLLRQSDGRWEWDDDNASTAPNASYTVTSGTQNYAIATTILSIDRVELKYTDGLWRVLIPIDKSDFPDTNLDQAFGSSGVPTHYDKVGDEIYLYPNPNFTQVTSLKIFFRRGPTLFTVADLTTGTVVPGFNSLYHDLIALWSAYYYGVANGKSNVNQLMQAIQIQENALKVDMSSRNKDERKKMTMRGILFR